MDLEIVGKWFAFWRPLELGFTPNGHANVLMLTLGVFWARYRGGYNLYRWTGDRLTPRLDRIVGAAGYDVRNISNFPFIKHDTSTVYWYLLCAVGGGGVEDATTHQVRRVEFGPDGEPVGPRPNSPTGLVIEPRFAGRLSVMWSYDATDQEVSPAGFEIYSDIGSPGRINYAFAVAFVPYDPARVIYEWTSNALPHGFRVWGAVRGVSSAGVTDGNTVSVAAVTDAIGPPVHSCVEWVKTDEAG